MMSKFIIYIFLITLLYSVAGCSSKAALISADNDYREGRYDQAAKKYIKIDKNIKSTYYKTLNKFKTAESYMAIGQPYRSELYYNGALIRKTDRKDIHIRLGVALKSNGKYKKAREQFQLQFDSGYLQEEAARELASLDFAENSEIDNSDLIFKSESALNSGYSDYGADIIGRGLSQVVFSSNRKSKDDGGEISPITGEQSGELYRTWYDSYSGRWERPKSIDDKNIINTLADEATISYANSGINYFSRAGGDEADTGLPKIYTTTGADNMWTEPILIDIVPDSIYATHPSISSSGDTLFFCSDLAGGLGGADIWFVVADELGWSAPINAGELVNSPGDEMFPYIRDNGELYFSSDYHDGFGGLDLFKVENDSIDGMVRLNLGEPYNSYGDDFGICFQSGKESGLLSSRRKGTRSDDIFSFEVPPVIYRVQGEVFDSESKQKISDARVRVVDSEGKNIAIDLKKNRFFAEINGSSDFVVSVYKPGYLNGKFLGSTMEMSKSHTFDLKLEITPTDKPITIDNLLFAFGTVDILPESISAIDKVTEILENNPSVVFELMAHTDAVGDAKYNLTLSQKRAEEVVKRLVERGISRDRLVAKGYGESTPKVVTKADADQYSFLSPGRILTESYLGSLKKEFQVEICSKLNRRVEFKVIAIDYDGI